MSPAAPTAPDAEGVHDRTRRGLSWSLAGAVATNLTRLVIVAILGRALDSNDFGIVAAAISVNVFFYSVRDIGIGRALVQRKELGTEHVATAFATSTYFGLGLTTLLVLGAPVLASIYRIPEAVNIIRGLALLFALRGVAITSRMMCQRAMDFRTIAIIDQVAFMTGSTTSVVLALMGGGPWALVIGYLLEEALGTAMYLMKAPPPFSLRVNGQRLRELMKFGTGETASQIVSTLATYGDNYIVGRELGAGMLGYYTRAYDLIKFPSTVFDMIAGNVLFPMFSRLQDDQQRLAVSFRRAMFVNALILLPASAVLVVLAPEAIRILMGAGWEASILPFRILAVTILMRTSWKVGAMIAAAAGRIRGVAIVNTVYMLTVIGGALLSIHWGIVGVAASTALGITVAFLGTTYLAKIVSGLSLRELVEAHVRGLILSAVALAVAFGSATVLRNSGAGTGPVFGAATVISIAAVLGVIFIWLRRRRKDFGWLADELARVRRRGSRTQLPPTR